MPRKKTPPGRRRGGQPGNRNAERHGFYSKRFTEDELSNLEDRDRFTVEDEIDLLRVYADRISRLVPLNGTQLAEMDLKALNTLSILSQSISTLIRTHYLVKGKGGAVEQSILEALEELRLELGL